MSDLIKQLGGYDKAQQYLKNLLSIPMHEQTEDTLVYLPAELLEYRRKWGLYDVNDIVVIGHHLYIIVQISKNNFVTIMRYPSPTKPRWTSPHTSQIRHATEVEIRTKHSYAEILEKFGGVERARQLLEICEPTSKIATLGLTISHRDLSEVISNEQK